MFLSYPEQEDPRRVQSTGAQMGVGAAKSWTGKGGSRCWDGEHRVDAGGQSQPSDLGSMADTLPCPGMAPAWFPAAELCQV